MEVGSGNIEILLFEIADEFHIVMFDDGWADFTVQPILTTNRIVYHPIHCVEILLRFVIWMTRHVSRHYIVIRSLDILLRWFYDFDLLFSKSACVIAKRAVFGTAWWVALDIRVEIAWSKLNVRWDVIHSDMAHDFCSVVCYCVQFRAGDQHLKKNERRLRVRKRGMGIKWPIVSSNRQMQIIACNIYLIKNSNGIIEPGNSLVRICLSDYL